MIAVQPTTDLPIPGGSIAFQASLLRRLEADERRSLLEYIRAVQGDSHAERLLAELDGAVPAERVALGAIPIVGDADWTRPDCGPMEAQWSEANLRNLRAGASHLYRRIAERRDFYRWFYEYTAGRGWETRWPLAASIVVSGVDAVAHMPRIEGVAAATGAVSNELQALMRHANQLIFDDVFAKLGALLEAGPLRGRAALEWDMQVLSEEQELVAPFYEGIDPEVFAMLENTVRKRWLVRVGAWRPFILDADEVAPGRFNRGGVVPPFRGDDFRCPDERWQYGMQLGQQFSPRETGFVPGMPRPAPRDGYRDGARFARVDFRPNLHRLEAELDSLLLADLDRAEIGRTLERLSPVEQAELLRDESPDGWAYSERLRQVLYPREIVRLVSGFRVGLLEQLRFLRACLPTHWGWRQVRYDDLRRMVTSFPVAERRRLASDEWRPIFLRVCDNDTIVDAVNDLDLPYAAKQAWVRAERRMF